VYYVELGFYIGPRKGQVATVLQFEQASNNTVLPYVLDESNVPDQDQAGCSVVQNVQMPMILIN
jgi:hypothetical protein